MPASQLTVVFDRLDAPMPTLFAAAAHHGSHTAFYILAACLVAWAISISALGIKRHKTFPSGTLTQSAVMFIALALVIATGTSAILTSI